MKFCKDCKYHVNWSVPGASFPGPPYSCYVRGKHSPVTGALLSDDAEVMRAPGGQCGPDALLFVQEPPAQPMVVAPSMLSTVAAWFRGEQ